MDLSYTPEERAFQDEVRTFLKEKLPKRLSDKIKSSTRLTKADMEEWHAILSERGWLAPVWPKEHGGAGWGPVQRHIFEMEATAAGAPRVVPFGVAMLAPVLLAFGSEAQKAHYLPRILDGTDWWCQGYSEPGSGSDLASLRTKADRDGDHYFVNGQKTWTTLGQFANWIFCLVRTSSEGKPQEGISFLLIDMDTPGVTVRPIITLDGEHEVNDVYLENVRVPVENLVGEENKGWTYAKYLLAHERTGIANVGNSTEAMRHLKHIASLQQKNGRPLADDPVFAMKVAALEVELEAMSTTNLRLIAAAAKGGAPGPETSMLKVKGSVIRQEINTLAMKALGPYAMPYASEALDEGSNVSGLGPDYANPLASEYFNNRKISIYGGSNEIQRGIITKAILGL